MIMIIWAAASSANEEARFAAPLFTHSGHAHFINIARGSSSSERAGAEAAYGEAPTLHFCMFTIYCTAAARTRPPLSIKINPGTWSARVLLSFSCFSRFFFSAIFANMRALLENTKLANAPGSRATRLDGRVNWLAGGGSDAHHAPRILFQCRQPDELCESYGTQVH